LWYEGKERRERDNDFNGEKGECLFLLWILFPLSLLLFSRFSQEKGLFPDKQLGAQPIWLRACLWMKG
jgi:hypothetical protein